MKFIEKWYNIMMYDGKFVAKFYGIGLGVLVLISLIMSCFVNYNSKFDLTEEYKMLSCVMEENRTKIQELIPQCQNGSITLDENYCISFSKDEVNVTYTKSENIFINRVQIKYSVTKDDNNFIISESYVKNNNLVFEEITSKCITYILIVLLFPAMILILITLILILCKTVILSYYRIKL